ncbi:hypothetical protein [Lichenicoccus sp.]|uniref:hypothetical protein n=1 Tax=Lichenicoccus sp. TaxID=2781899 RepID=UPI003D0D1080
MNQIRSAQVARRYGALAAWAVASLLVRFWLFRHLPVRVWPGAALLLMLIAAGWFCRRTGAHHGNDARLQKAMLALVGMTAGYLLLPARVRHDVVGSACGSVTIVLVVMSISLALAWVRIAQAKEPNANLRTAFEGVLPAVLISIAYREMAILRSLLLQWRRKPTGGSIRIFAYHRNGIDLALCWVIFFATVPEVCVTHLVVAHWTVRWAWVATKIGALGGLYVAGLAKSLYIRPIELHSDHLLLRNGALRELELQLRDIVSVDASDGAPKSPVVKMWLFEPPNVAIRLRRGSSSAQSAGGLDVAFYVDEPRAFLSALDFARPSGLP